MSLTQELRRRDGPMARWMLDTFPHHHELARRYRLATANLRPTVEPGRGVNPGTVGTAFDWRIRLLFQPVPDLALATFGLVWLRRRPVCWAPCMSCWPRSGGTVEVSVKLTRSGRRAPVTYLRC